MSSSSLYTLLVLSLAVATGVVAQQCAFFSCDAGWTQWGPSPTIQFCYKTIEPASPVAFTDGQTICHGSNAELTSVHSVAEQDFVAALALEQDSSHVKSWWIGMRLEWTDGKFLPTSTLPKQVRSTWTDGTVVDLGNANVWYTNEPNGNQNASKVGCVFYDATEGYYWDDIDCATTTYASAKFGAVCKLNSINDCNLPYWAIAGNATAFNGACYQVLPAAGDGYTHDQAETACNSIDGHLVSVHSQEENDFIFELIKAVEQQAAYPVNVGANNHYWTGLVLHHDNPASPVLVSGANWIDGTDVVFGHPYPWAVGGGPGLQPDGPNYPSAATGAVQLVGNSLNHWNDNSPTALSTGVVCKKPASTLTGVIIP